MTSGAGSDSDCFRKRSLIVLLFFAFWAVLSAGFMIRHSFFRRETLLTESTRIAWREGKIPPVRGKILSADSKVILHTLLLHDLMMRESPHDMKIIRTLNKKIKVEPVKQPNGLLLLKRGIEPDEIAAVQDEMKRFPVLFIRPVMKRICTEKSLEAKAGRLGPVRAGDSMMRGLSGWELEYDAKLRGEPGIFRVMRDRSGAWVPGTLEVVRKPRHGEDVRLKWTWKELTGK